MKYVFGKESLRKSAANLRPIEELNGEKSVEAQMLNHSWNKMQEGVW